MFKVVSKQIFLSLRQSVLWGIDLLNWRKQHTFWKNILLLCEFACKMILPNRAFGWPWAASCLSKSPVELDQPQGLIYILLWKSEIPLLCPNYLSDGLHCLESDELLRS